MGLPCKKARKHRRSKIRHSTAVTKGPGGARTFEGVEPMGRGRAKAKQVKVARQLKYSGGGTDLDRLRAELGVGTDEQEADRQAAYADFSDRYSVDDEDYDDDALDDGGDLDGEAPDGKGYDVESLADDPADRYSGDGGSPAARMSRTTGA